MTQRSRFEMVNEIVGGAVELAAREREAYVHQCCGPDAGLAAEALHLLGLGKAADRLLVPCGGEPQPGDVLGGRFRIIEELGYGGAGTVFLAEDCYSGLVALKLVHPNLLAGVGAIELAAAELKAGRAVSHPNVCPAYDLFRFDDAPCGPVAALTMKYLPGETLQARLAHGPLDPGEALAIARGAASGLNAIHAAGIVHGDFKPGNLMLTPTNGGALPVILDFGLAATTNSVKASPASGSPRYMAPERFRSAPLTAAADVYAFGLLFFEMIAGKLPFIDEDLVSAAIRRNTEEPRRLSALAGWAPAGWDAVIAQALSRNPQDRPHSAMDVIALLTDEVQPEAARKRCCSSRWPYGVACAVSPRHGRVAGRAAVQGI
jgi:serine/threonine protein kinase